MESGSFESPRVEYMPPDFAWNHVLCKIEVSTVGAGRVRNSPGVAAPLLNEGVCQNILFRKAQACFPNIFICSLNILIHFFNLSNKRRTIVLAFKVSAPVMYSI
jgi:hypothetical protein